MLSFFKTLSLSRGGWFLLAFSGLALEIAALYFQHGMKLDPCVMCIYERIALFGIIFAGLIGIIAPKVWLIRFTALLFGLGCAVKGLLLSWRHLDYQLNPSPWNQCPIVPDFPATLPLDKWLPNVFQATGSCSEVLDWHFLGLSMVPWLVIIFAIYIVIMLLLLVSQFARNREKNIFH